MGESPFASILYQLFALPSRCRINKYGGSSGASHLRFRHLPQFDHRHAGLSFSEIAQAVAFRYAEIDDLFARAAEKGEDPFFILLDGIEDPHNLGAIIRTANLAGAHGVIIPKRRSAGITAVVDKASAGAAEHIRVARVPNISAAIRELKDRGLWVYGAEADAPAELWDTSMTGSICLVIGSEGFGLSRLVRENCDVMVRIPLRGKVTSLNASASAAVMIYEVVRQRLAAEKREG